MNQTKIIATIGPATDSEETLTALLDAGVDIFRQNFSHGTLAQHAEVYHRIRKVCQKKSSHAAIMIDLCGPKIRVDEVEGGSFPIEMGDHLDILAEHIIGTPGRISTNRPALVREVSEGHRILIDDGAVLTRVLEKHETHLHCICEVGGHIATRKGLNLPDSDLMMSALTEDDKVNAAWAFANNADYVAMSFVRSAADLQELRDMMPLDCECPLVAKIETSHAIQHLDAIIDSSDVVLVARGDLGVEMDLAKVPILQKDILQRCQKAGKPAITATQMLQSMVTQPTATRAEVSDVANAILDTSDCVMLSAETSVGKYPIESIKMMSRIARQTETLLKEKGMTSRVNATSTLRLVTTAVAHSTAMLANELNARLVVLWTQVGNTARLLSKCRLNRPIVGLSPDESVCRRMSMYFGVVPVQMKRKKRTLDMINDVDKMLLQKNLVDVGDLIVVVAGTRLEQAGSTNALLIHLVSDSKETSPTFT